MTISRLQDIHDMHECRARYGWAWDTNDAELMLTAFTPDATNDTTAFGGGPLTGHDALREMFVNVRPAMEAHFQAFFPTALVEFDGEDRAVGHTNFYAEAYMPGNVTAHIRGAWKDTFVRTEAGWRIEHGLGLYRVPVTGMDAALEGSS